MFNINQVATKVKAEWFDADSNSYSKSFTIKTSASVENVVEQLGRWIEKSRSEIKYLGEPVHLFFEFKGRSFHVDSDQFIMEFKG